MDNFTALRKIGQNFWNIRGSFTIGFGLIDLGTQMSIVKLNNGNFMVIDTIPITPTMKTEIDFLTNNGELLESVVAVHPFHTLYFDPFYKLYPNAKYYGTPRHLERLKGIPWAGEISSSSIINNWDGDVSFSVTPGLDYETYPEAHHASSVLAYHHTSKTVHIDDTFSYFDQAPFPLNWIGVKSKKLMPGLNIKKALANSATPNAEGVFRKWYVELLDKWDIQNACIAHDGVCTDDTKDQFARLVKFFDEK